MQDAVVKLVGLGKFPSYEDKDVSREIVEQYEAAIRAISRPVSDEEAIALCRLFGPDDFFGMAWTVLHSVETARGWPIAEALAAANDPWREALSHRLRNVE